MFDNLGWWEIIFLGMLAVIVFGPERLPEFVKGAAGFLRKARQTMGRATAEFQEQLGPDIEIADLHPKRFVQRHLLSQDDLNAMREPFAALQRDLDMKALSSGDWKPGDPLPSPVPRFDPDAT